MNPGKVVTVGALLLAIGGLLWLRFFVLPQAIEADARAHRHECRQFINAVRDGREMTLLLAARPDCAKELGK